MNTNALSASYEAFITIHNLQIIGLSNINELNQEHNIVYKIVNKINGKHYIGQHITLNPLDEYIGSGNMITKAKLKYGLSSFIKEILFDFDNFDDMNQKEIELVPLSACYPYDQTSYNLMEGGHCGRLTDETKKKLSESKKGEKNPYHRSHERINPAKGKTVLERFHYDIKKYEAWKKANSEGHKGLNTGENNWMYGKKWSEVLDPITRQNAIEKSRQKRKGQKRTTEQRKHISDAHKGKMTGKNHRLYGKTFAEWLSPEKYNEWLLNNQDKNRQPIPLDFMPKENISQWKEKLKNAFKGRIRIYNPLTGNRHTINLNELQTYLDKGWIIGYNCSSIGGKIAIHHSITHKNKYIFKEELETYINDGWIKGLYKDPNRISKIVIYNDIVDKIIKIDPKDYVSYYYDGWTLDLPHHKSKGKILIRNEDTHETKTIEKTELQSYLDNGWKKGRFPNIKSKTKNLINKNNKFI